MTKKKAKTKFNHTPITMEEFRRRSAANLKRYLIKSAKNKIAFDKKYPPTK